MSRMAARRLNPGRPKRSDQMVLHVMIVYVNSSLANWCSCVVRWHMLFCRASELSMSLYWAVHWTTVSDSCHSNHTGDDIGTPVLLSINISSLFELFLILLWIIVDCTRDLLMVYYRRKLGLERVQQAFYVYINVDFEALSGHCFDKMWQHIAERQSVHSIWTVPILFKPFIISNRLSIIWVALYFRRHRLKMSSEWRHRRLPTRR